jgi:FkbM family methyltransferase
MSLAGHMAKAVASAGRTMDAALKLSDLMSKRDSIRLVRALQQKDPTELPVAGNIFRLRRGTTDLYTFDDVFLQKSIEAFSDQAPNPSCIIDCGAHIGCASLFFALKYPGCRIISIEPDKQNFELLCANMQTFTNVLPLNAAVWDRTALVTIANPGTNPTGLYVEEALSATDRGVPGMTIPEILKRAGEDHIDILKVDIEGAERRLFSSPECQVWLSKTSSLIVELHDRLLPGCARALYRALDDYNYESFGRGYVVIVELKGKDGTRLTTPQIERLSSVC